jgi:hypothetical protein
MFPSYVSKLKVEQVGDPMQSIFVQKVFDLSKVIWDNRVNPYDFSSIQSGDFENLRKVEILKIPEKWRF